ncbi:rCG36265, partial [Rattus norvegicus]
MAKVTKKSKDTVSEMNVPTSSSETQEVAKPIMPIKTKAAYKLYPPSILCGK